MRDCRRGPLKRREGDGAWARLDLGTERGESKEPDSVIANLGGPGAFGPIEDFAVGIDGVRRQDREVCFGNAFSRDDRPEIIFMVTGDHDVETGGVVQVNHVGALIEAGHQRGRDCVAAIGQDDIVAGGALRIHNAHKTGHAALPATLFHAVEVIHVQNGQMHGFCRGGEGKYWR